MWTKRTSGKCDRLPKRPKNQQKIWSEIRLKRKKDGGRFGEIPYLFCLFCTPSLDSTFNNHKERSIECQTRPPTSKLLLGAKELPPECELEIWYNLQEREILSYKYFSWLFHFYFLIFQNLSKTPLHKRVGPRDIWYNLRDIYIISQRKVLSASEKYSPALPLILGQMTKSILSTCFSDFLKNVCSQCPTREKL